MKTAFTLLVQRGNRWYIGEYSTREKALKVLDEIQKLIYDYQLGGVFQMPQDDEVEEWYFQMPQDDEVKE